MPDLIEISRSFLAMNAVIELIVCVPDSERADGEEALRRAESIFYSVEAALSRFKPESELSRLNRSAGTTFAASSLLFTTVGMAKDAARNTGGIFDPTVLPLLLEAGYDRSFEALSQRSESPVYLTSRYNWEDIHLNTDCSSIFIPAGCAIDLGGIGKGWTVDQAGVILDHFSGYAVDGGGDIRIGGRRADGSLWPVGVADPLKPEDDLMIISLSDCAICTSSTVKRHWQRGAYQSHHLIDTRTGKPSASSIISATVVSKSAAFAEVIAKTALVLGPEEGFAYIRDQQDAYGLLVQRDGRLLRTARFSEVADVN